MGKGSGVEGEGIMKRKGRREWSGGRGELRTERERLNKQVAYQYHDSAGPGTSTSTSSLLGMQVQVQVPVPENCT